MKRYITFLRGVNISGKNKVPMLELKKVFEKLNFEDVRTYLNSGNVIFSSNEDNIIDLTNKIETMINKNFGFNIPTFTISKDKLENILHNAPKWWENENREIYNNLIFIIPPATFDDVYNEIGEPKKGLEKIENYGDVVFWSFNRKEYNKTNWWHKTASSNISIHITIRTANTVRKLSSM